MITIVDVMRAVSRTAEAVFGAPPVTKDLREGFARPCTKLSLLYSDVSRELVRFAARTDRGWIDLLRAQAALTEALERPIRVDEQFHLVAEEVDFDPVREDMALYCTFSVEWFQEAPEDDWRGGSEDKMDALDVNDEAWVRPDDD